MRCIMVNTLKLISIIVISCFISLMKKEKCGVHMPPIVVRLEKLEDEYIDSDGREIQVWKIFQNKLWALIEKNKVHINKPKKIQV